MAAPADVAALMQVLSPATVVLHHHEHFYGHLDFTWGIDAHKRVYPAVIKFLRDRNSRSQRKSDCDRCE